MTILQSVWPFRSCCHRRRFPVDDGSPQSASLQGPSLLLLGSFAHFRLKHIHFWDTEMKLLWCLYPGVIAWTDKLGTFSHLEIEPDLWKSMILFLRLSFACADLNILNLWVVKTFKTWCASPDVQVLMCSLTVLIRSVIMTHRSRVALWCVVRLRCCDVLLVLSHPEVSFDCVFRIRSCDLLSFVFSCVIVWCSYNTKKQHSTPGMRNTHDYNLLTDPNSSWLLFSLQKRQLSLFVVLTL